MIICTLLLGFINAVIVLVMKCRPDGRLTVIGNGLLVCFQLIFGNLTVIGAYSSSSVLDVILANVEKVSIVNGCSD